MNRNKRRNGGNTGMTCPKCGSMMVQDGDMLKCTKCGHTMRADEMGEDDDEDM